MSSELTLENIESLLYDKPNSYKYCRVFEDDDFLCSFEFDENNRIIKIIDSDNNSAKYSYNNDIITIEAINCQNKDKLKTYYRVLANTGNIIFEYVCSTNVKSKIKYRFGNIHNKYLSKYHLDKLMSIYSNNVTYKTKYLDNGFEIYYDRVPVYRELYNDKDQLVELYILDYNCMTTNFKYLDDKVIEQKIYCNRDLLSKIKYEYYENGLLMKEYSIDDRIYLYYYYNSDNSIAKIDTKFSTYNFIYSND